MKYFALFLAVYCLVVAGFGATTRLTNSGLGCPDWPGCYGALTAPESAEEVADNSLLVERALEVPKAKMEMLHRFVAGGLILGMVIYLLITLLLPLENPARETRQTAFLTLILLLLQGIFGALTVTLKLLPIVVTIHLLLALTTFLLLLTLAIKIHFMNPEDGPRIKANFLYKFLVRVFATALITVVIIQFALGGWVASNYAATACPDLPLCNGELVPSTMDIKEAFKPNFRVGPDYEYGSQTPYAERVAIHFSHRVFALIVLLVALLTTGLLMLVKLNKLAYSVIGLITVQIFLGLSNVYFQIPLIVALIHNLTAFLICGLSLFVYYVVTREEYEVKQEIPKTPIGRRNKDFKSIHPASSIKNPADNQSRQSSALSQSFENEIQASKDKLNPASKDHIEADFNFMGVNSAPEAEAKRGPEPQENTKDTSKKQEVSSQPLKQPTNESTDKPASVEKQLDKKLDKQQETPPTQAVKNESNDSIETSTQANDNSENFFRNSKPSIGSGFNKQQEQQENFLKENAASVKALADDETKVAPNSIKNSRFKPKPGSQPAPQVKPVEMKEVSKDEVTETIAEDPKKPAVQTSNQPVSQPAVENTPKPNPADSIGSLDFLKAKQSGETIETASLTKPDGKPTRFSKVIEQSQEQKNEAPAIVEPKSPAIEQEQFILNNVSKNSAPKVGLVTGADPEQAVDLEKPTRFKAASEKSTTEPLTDTKDEQKAVVKTSPETSGETDNQKTGGETDTADQPARFKPASTKDPANTTDDSKPSASS